jgi:pyruvate dehydrogenase E1 component alpha subunit
VEPMFQILDPTGRVVGAVPPELTDEQLTEMFRLMLFGRAVDQKAISLQRRGKLGTFAPMMGQEAASVGSVFALDPETDWVVPQYREQLAMLHWGLELSTYFLQRQGHPAGSTLPTHRRLFPQQVALGAHLPQAVGVAWGMRLRGERSVALAYFGDGASSEGDFHEALNLAGVQRAPVIFVCQNNQWAISTPVTSQTAAATIAGRAAGYGIAGIQVDGNDALAMYAATRDARTRALDGDGATLIEAVTYRLGAHTTSDDPTRYVDPAEHERWRGRDPLVRFEAWLRATGRWDDDAQELADKWCEAEVDRAQEGIAAAGPPDPLSLFDNVYAEEPEALRRQRAAVRELVEGREPPDAGRDAGAGA